eukprot:Nk52_evm47s230 gene=Nk52_evmTU47s230
MGTQGEEVANFEEEFANLEIDPKADSAAWFCHMTNSTLDKPERQEAPAAETQDAVEEEQIDHRPIQISQIPDLSAQPAEESSERRDSMIPENGGSGRDLDLLSFPLTYEKSEEPVPYPFCDWFAHNAGNLSKGDEGLIPAKPTWMVHPDNQPITKRKNYVIKPPYSIGNNWESTPSCSTAGKKKKKLPPLKKLPKPAKCMVNFVNDVQIPKKNKVPPVNNDKINFHLLLSHGYQSDWTKSKSPKATNSKRGRKASRPQGKKYSLAPTQPQAAN